jgi:hypothetical protein
VSGREPYRGKRFSLLTQHGKERVIAPLLAERLDVRVELATGFDTDTLGTFTREIPRDGTQLEAARKKATTGMDLLHLDHGLASEGAFGAAPFGFFPWNVEVVVLVDRERDIEIVGRAQGPARHLHEHVTSLEALASFARRAGVPDHGLVVRPDGENDPRVRKGLTGFPALREAFEEAMAEAQSSSVFVENDLRAHMNPTRMGVIREATSNQNERIESSCPRCGTPGFWRVERTAGLPCRDCGSPTDEPRAERWACITTDHFEIRDLSRGRFADPYRCNTCNP